MTLPAKILAFVFFIIVAVVIYFPSFYSPFQLDDYVSIVNNSVMRSLKSIVDGKIWFFDPSRYIPYSSFVLNFYFSELNVLGYHLVNFFTHVLASIGVFLLSKKVFEKFELQRCFLGTKKISNLEAAYISGFIFLLHPVQTSAVNYIHQRSALFATLFYVFSVYFYLTFHQSNRIKFYWFSLGAVLFGVFCKPIIITVPFLIIFLDFLIDRKSAEIFDRGKLIRYVLYFCVVALVPVLLIIWKYKVLDLSQILSVTKETGNIAMARKDYLFTQINVVRTYIRLLIFPVYQNLDYDYFITKSFFNFSTVASFGLLSSVFLTGIKFLKRNKTISFAIFWFFITLSVESSIFPIADVIFEHRLYLPMVGFALLLPAVIFSVIKNERIARGVLIGVLIVYAILSFQRNQLWSNRILFLEDMVKKSPNKARVYENLAFAYFEAGNYEKAIQYYSSAITLKPDYTASFLQRGLCYSAIKKFKLALVDYDELLLIDPRHVLAQNNRGTVYHALGQYSLALKSYDRAIELDPTYAVAYYNRGVVYALQGKNDLAIENFNKAIKLNPKYINAYHSRGIEYGNKKQYGRAIDDFNYVIQNDPQNGKGYFNRAITFQKMGNEKSAKADFQEALKRGYNIGQSN